MEFPRRAAAAKQRAAARRSHPHDAPLTLPDASRVVLIRNIMLNYIPHNTPRRHPQPASIGSPAALTQLSSPGPLLPAGRRRSLSRSGTDACSPKAMRTSTTSGSPAHSRTGASGSQLTPPDGDVPSGTTEASGSTSSFSASPVAATLQRDSRGGIGARQDWWRRVDSNHRHRAYETPALPTELRRHAYGIRGVPGDSHCQPAS
jgi:hypothetical protein